MTRKEKERLLAEIEKQYKWLMTKSPTIYMIDIAFDAIRKAVRDEASKELEEPQISLDTYKQVAKERDIAIEQLHELGYEFGEKIETTKNDLVVDAISRQAINGYIDYILSHGMGKKKSFDFIKKFVANMPSVTPQEPFINKPCVSEKSCKHDKNVVLDKIRAEIVDLGQRTMNDNRASGIWACRDIIDKYKAESEE